MVRSCLVQPLVAPLVGSGTRGPGRRTGLSRSRLLATALTATLLVTVATQADAVEAAMSPHQVEMKAGTAHQKPKPIPTRDLLQVLMPPVVSTKTVLLPGVAPHFDWDAVEAHRRRQRVVPHDGASLATGRRLDRLIRCRSSVFLRFHSGKHRSGAPAVHLA